MSTVSIKKVETGREMDDFVRFAGSHYAGCPQYVPDLESDVRNTFDPRKNAGLEFTDIQAFVAYHDGKPVGRIAGIINHHANEKWNKRNVRFGFIEFIDDQEVSRALIDAVAEWGRERGMDRIQGPMGITDFDKEGMLVEDFDLTGSVTAIYNYDYYPRHIEALGFVKEADWLQVRVEVPTEIPAKYARVAQYAREQVGLKVIKVTSKDIRGEYGKKIFHLLNAAYSPLFGYTELSEGQINDFVKQYISLVDKKLIPLVENTKGELVGVAITMTSMVEAFQRSGGRLWPFGWWHLLGGLKWNKADHAEMLLIAVRPDYQGLGVNALFFDDLIPIYNEYGIKWAETGPQLEDNMRELNQWKPLNPKTVKRRRCYTRKI
jgi:GNAT superfamily N-acetyltransferase